MSDINQSVEPHVSIPAAELERLRAELEAVNALGRQWGFGQGELDDDLAGCLSRKLESERAARESDLQAIIDWLATDKPPELAFTSGPQRRIADEIAMLRAAREAAAAKVLAYQEELSEVISPEMKDTGAVWHEQIEGGKVPMMRGSPRLTAFVTFLHHTCSQFAKELSALRSQLATVTAERDRTEKLFNNGDHLLGKLLYQLDKIEDHFAETGEIKGNGQWRLRSIGECVVAMRNAVTECAKADNAALTESEAK